MNASPKAARLLALFVVLALILPGWNGQPAGAQSDARYFPESGFRIDNDRIWSFFGDHGGARAFGPPISRTFRLLGMPSQLFQYHLLQVTDTEDVQVTSLLDSGWMPYRQIGGIPIPPYDPTVTVNAPVISVPSYVDDMLAYLQSSLPDELDGRPTRFYQTFAETIAPLDWRADAAELAVLILRNLDVWGIPTGRPLRDPKNPGQVLVRLERGVLRYDASCGCTAPLPFGSYFRAVLTGSELPLDVERQVPDSPYLRQYDLGTHTGPHRAGLPETELGYAFLPSLQPPLADPADDGQAAAFAPTSTPVVQPTSTPQPASGAPAPGAAPDAAAPLPAPAPLNRAPADIVLRRNESGRETTLVSQGGSEDARAIWYSVRYERERDAETSGIGPNILHNTVYVARNQNFAKQIWGEQIAIRNFPEAVDRFGGWFYLPKPVLGQESHVLGSCFEEGCNATRYNIHLRLVFRNKNIVSVFYTYGDQLSASLDQVAYLAKNVANRML